MRIPIVIHKDRDSDYGVTVPDLPGCFSAGRTLDEAIEMAREAVECHIEGMIEDDEPVPALQPIEMRQQNPDYAGGAWVIVEIDLARLQSTARRINITVPERVLRRVDRAAERAGESRSGFFTRAALEAARAVPQTKPSLGQRSGRGSTERQRKR